ncbi:MAG: DUF4301 family protein [Prevotellaceae bacterium]|jgi:hypothetical protein|nr:DUF4301 family protein [Prevotellaceae bacterium]
MFNKNDLEQLNLLGISAQKAEQQIRGVRNGFPYLRIEKAAEIGDGIVVFSEQEKQRNIEVWHDYLASDKGKVLKFVPASGAASRMFKDLFAFLDGKNQTVDNEFIEKFFNEIKQFAFYDELDEFCKQIKQKSVEQLIENKEYKAVLEILLDTGLNYGNLPKGLLLFHQYKDGARTPFLEHFVEGVLYAKNAKNIVNLHFTVSSEHKNLFVNHLNKNRDNYQKRYGVVFNTGFSEQKKNTDTVALNIDNEPFREYNGSLVFRPGGHGALIENLNDLDADVVFVKNIDNVVSDRLKELTVEYKKLIAGVLVNLQQQTFSYLKEMENPEISEAKLQIITKFCQTRLNNFNPNIANLNRSELISYLKTKLNRPVRVCGMVKNEGEPGGGPYLVYNADGTISPQILESSQINVKEDSQKKMMDNATHFNPVDLVCGLKNYRGEKFYLPDFVDENTCFVSSKSKNGKELKALELPGLWNGAMSNWNTIFVEVPIESFNPVKNVNDLLREQHQ